MKGKNDFGVNYNESRSGLVGLFVGIMVAAVVGIGATVPIVAEKINEVTGTTSIVIGLIPLFIALLLIVAIARSMMWRMP